MKTYFYLAKNYQGLMKSGLASGIRAFDAYSKVAKLVTNRSDDVYVVVKFELVE